MSRTSYRCREHRPRNTGPVVTIEARPDPYLPYVVVTIGDTDVYLTPKVAEALARTTSEAAKLCLEGH